MSEAWPTWARQSVEISETDPGWERHAAELLADLERRLAYWLAGHVEHVGSTAMPGLAAKAIIDLMAPVSSLIDSGRADDVLAEAGWHLVPPELDQRPWRRMHVLPDGERRLAHLHLVEPTHPRWRDVLLFRDRLRLHPELVAEYTRSSGSLLKRTRTTARRTPRRSLPSCTRSSTPMRMVQRSPRRGDVHSAGSRQEDRQPIKTSHCRRAAATCG